MHLADRERNTYLQRSGMLQLSYAPWEMEPLVLHWMDAPYKDGKVWVEGEVRFPKIERFHETFGMGRWKRENAGQTGD
jgi:hypothetical protein